MENKNKNLNRAIIIAVYVLALFLFVGVLVGIKSMGVIGEGITPTNTISVSGTGNAFAVPNIATVDFDITAEAAQVPDAQTQVTNQTNAVLAWLKGQNVADTDVKTTNYSIEPQYEYKNQAIVCPVVSGGTTTYCPPNQIQVLTGYNVTDSLEVTIRDTSKAGAILAGLGSQKVNNLSGLNFSVDNPNSVEAQARAMAIDDAKSKAQVLSGQLGVRLGRIVSFSEGNSGPIYEPMMLSASAATANGSSAPVPQIPAGQNKVTSNVTITYQIN
jgi:uncharacterized protein YggE